MGDDGADLERRVDNREDGRERAVCDYIAGMTDQYAVDTFRRLFIPQAWSR